ncbi:HK97 gp10 family phage protein [Nocardia gipuzkoensis]|uniref:HK97 gp10 family phage protein n=1 Tax=Nocardia gipuzkoensis TaxID=2749991 RepID=UPI00237D69BA|nr:HK97 gp10 family phage protein [Nocardia gipuzkoensis]MDE1673865.1 HK97 gp10 family phage protein [Nocardia gipuzkoensis]
MPIQTRARMVFRPPPGVQARAVAHAATELDDLGRRIVFNAKRRVNVRSGELRDSIGHNVTADSSQARLRVFATARHARWVHDGTRAHEIRPLNAKALRFEVGGRVVFARRVWHPGYAGNPFLRDAATEELGRLI